MDFMTVIKNCKTRNNYTNDQLAELIGVTNVTVNNWLHGKCTPNIADREIIEHISNVSKVSVGDIVKAIMLSLGYSIDIKDIKNPYYDIFKIRETEFFKMTEAESKAFLENPQIYMEYLGKEYSVKFRKDIDKYKLKDFIRDCLLSKKYNRFDPAILSDKDLYEFLSILGDIGFGKIALLVLWKTIWDIIDNKDSRLSYLCMQFNDGVIGINVPDSIDHRVYGYCKYIIPDLKNADCLGELMHMAGLLKDNLSDDYYVFVNLLDLKDRLSSDLIQHAGQYISYDEDGIKDCYIPRLTKKSEMLIELFEKTHTLKNNKWLKPYFMTEFEKYAGSETVISGVVIFKGCKSGSSDQVVELDDVYVGNECLCLKLCYEDNNDIFKNVSIGSRICISGYVEEFEDHNEWHDAVLNYRFVPFEVISVA